MSEISPQLAPPVNYTALQVPADPVGSFLKGVDMQSVMNLRNAQATQAMAAAGSQMFQLQRQQQFMQGLNGVMQNPTPQGMAQLMMAFPEQHQALSAAYDMSQYGQAVLPKMQAYQALQAGRTDIAKNILQQQYDAQVNSGVDPNSPQMRLGQQIIDDVSSNDPAAINRVKGLFLTGISMAPKGKEYLEQLSSAQKLPSDSIKSAADADKAVSDARTAQVGAQFAAPKAQADLAQTQASTGSTVAGTAEKLQGLQKTAMFGNLPESAVTLINESNKAAEEHQVKGDQAANLAQRVADASQDWNKGNMGAWKMKWQEMRGSQDAVNTLQKEADLLTKEGILGLKSRITDTDFKALETGVPGPNASPQQVATFMTALSNAHRQSALLAEAKSDWVSQVGSMKSAPRTITVQGVQVPAGTTYLQYIRNGLPNASPAVTRPTAAPGMDATPQPSVPSYFKYGQ